MDGNCDSGRLVAHVQDTAWHVAEMRVIESERPDALFRDALARKLTGNKGKDFLACFPTGGNFMMAMRTPVIDELIYQLVRSHSDVVLNLAAGLDTRPYRLELPCQLRWIEVDYPSIIQYKNETLAEDRPMCKLERHPLDLSDDQARRDLLQKVGQETQQGIVITEGLLGYLTKENVTTLSLDLHAQESIRWWIMDLVTPTLISWMQSQVASREPAAELPDMHYEEIEFYQAHGWETAAFHSFASAGQRLKRMPPSDCPVEVTAALEQSGVALLKRAV